MKKKGSLRSATTPTKGDRLLISLPVEQQLLELKPNGSKTWQHLLPYLVRQQGEYLVGPSARVQLLLRCASKSRRRACSGLARAIFHRRPARPQAQKHNACKTKGKSFPALIYFLFSLCRPCSCGDRRVHCAYHASSSCTVFSFQEIASLRGGGGGAVCDHFGLRGDLVLNRGMGRGLTTQWQSATAVNTSRTSSWGQNHPGLPSLLNSCCFP